MTTIVWGHPGFVLVNVVEAFGVDNTGATDCGAALTACAPKLVASGQAMWLPPGTYTHTTPFYLPSGLVVVGSPGVSLVADGLLTWMWQSVYAPRPPAGTPTTLASATTVGSDTISITSNLGGTVVAGADILVTDANGIGAIYTVQSITGSGPYSVVVDRLVLWPLAASGSLVQVLSFVPTDITIHGNGMKMSGTAWRYLDIMGGLRCYASDLVVDASLQTASNYSVSIDEYGRQNVLERIHVNGGGNANVSGCIACELNEGSRLVDCVAFGAKSTGLSPGIMISGCADVIVDGCQASGGSQYGLYVGADSEFLTGVSYRVQVIGGAYQGNGVGILVDGGTYAGYAVDTVLVGVSCGFNQANGLINYGARTHIADIDVTQNNLAAVAATPFLSLQAGTVVNGLRCALNDHGGNVVSCAAGATFLSGVDVLATSITTNCIEILGGRATVSGHFAGGGLADNIGIIIGASAVGIVDNFIFDGAGSATTGVYTYAGSTLRLGKNVDVSACATPMSVAGYCSRNLGEAVPNYGVVLTGATAVAVAWPDLQPSDKVVPILEARGASGSTGVMPLVSYTPGTGFSFTGVATQIDTMGYTID